MNSCLPAILAFFAGATGLAAQCSLQPIATGFGMPSLDGDAFNLAAWDPDGPGPLPEKLVVYGDFTLAGNLVADRVAAFDPVTNQWSPLGHLGRSPTFGVMPNGTLLAAANGYFVPTFPTSTLLAWAADQRAVATRRGLQRQRAGPRLDCQLERAGRPVGADPDQLAASGVWVHEVVIGAIIVAAIALDRWRQSRAA